MFQVSSLPSSSPVDERKSKLPKRSPKSSPSKEELQAATEQGLSLVPVLAQKQFEFVS